MLDKSLQHQSLTENAINKFHLEGLSARTKDLGVAFNELRKSGKATFPFDTLNVTRVMSSVGFHLDHLLNKTNAQEMIGVLKDLILVLLENKDLIVVEPLSSKYEKLYEKSTYELVEIFSNEDPNLFVTFSNRKGLGKMEDMKAVFRSFIERDSIKAIELFITYLCEFYEDELIPELRRKNGPELVALVFLPEIALLMEKGYTNFGGFYQIADLLQKFQNEAGATILELAQINYQDRQKLIKIASRSQEEMPVISTRHYVFWKLFEDLENLLNRLKDLGIDVSLDKLYREGWRKYMNNSVYLSYLGRTTEAKDEKSRYKELLIKQAESKVNLEA